MSSDHQQSIDLLAQRSNLPVAEVAQIYKDALSELSSEARVKGFLPIFAARKVKDMLRQRSISGQAAL